MKNALSKIRHQNVFRSPETVGIDLRHSVAGRSGVPESDQHRRCSASVIASAVVTILVAGVLLGVLAFAACRPAEVTSPITTQKPLSSERPLSPTQPAQGKWETAVAEARKEGTLNVYNTAVLGAELRASLSKTFKDKYAIDVEFSPLVGTELANRVKAEQRAGLHIADVFMAGTTTFLNTMKPDGLLGSIEPRLMLPEVLDSNNWYGGTLWQLGEYDRERSVGQMLMVVARTLMYNTQMVKPEEVESYRDLLKPRFKEMIGMPQVTDVGEGVSIINHLVEVYGWDNGLAFVRELFTKQKPAIVKDGRLLMESVARGKYALSLGGSNQYQTAFINLGAPVNIRIPKEGDYFTTSFGGLAVPTRSPHPNTATVYINWLLSKEGQTLFSKGAGSPSRRVDVPLDGVPLMFRPQPGEKLYQKGPQIDLRTPKVAEAMKELLRDIERGG
ncbi:MAG: extracellular solute-binding protein [Chloroflexi bacterium]|nr:extracellular solute-binding protein [Chloroflexota bacterium]